MFRAGDRAVKIGAKDRGLFIVISGSFFGLGEEFPASS
jgi:hypothetical protein